MKKITTTFLLLALAMLLPMKTMAEDYYLHYATDGNWGPVENGQLLQVDGKYEVTFTIPAANTEKFYFCVFNSKETNWDNAIRPEKGNGTDGNNTNMSGKLDNSSQKVWLWETSSSTDVTLKLVCDINNNSWTLTKLSDEQGGGDDDDTPVDPINTEHGTSSNGNAYYLVSVGHDTGTNTADNIFAEKETQLEDNDHKVYYNRILRFNDNGNGTYTIAIPTTITGKVYIEEIQKSGASKFYGPQTNYYLIKDIAYEASGRLTSAETEENAGSNNGINVWSVEDRGNEDGLYIITVFLGTDGNPLDWAFDYDASRRVAYFLSTAELSSANPIYDKRADNNQGRFNNTFESDIFFDGTNNINYYVISNIVVGSDYVSDAQKFDNTATTNRNGGDDILPTVNKLLLLGNEGNEFKNQDPYNEFSPNEKPMQTSDVLKGLCHVKYNPSNGNQNKLSDNHYGIRGQLEFNEGAKQNVSMAIVGPLFEKSMKEGGNIDYTYLASEGEPNNIMTYNDTEHYYELTVETTDEQNMKEFVFVANQSPSNIWYDYDRFARNPYYAAGPNTTSAATTQDPNKVRHGASGDINDATYKKINFNRPAGKWTIRFYIVNTIQGTQYYYTISSAENITQEVPVVTVGTEKMIIRTFSYAADLKPLDEKVHIYVAHNFVKDEEKEEITKTITGNVNLYEINYVPAGEGVVLLYTGEASEDENHVKLNFTLANEYNVDNYKESLTDKKYLWTKYNDHVSEDWNNDLVGTLKDTPVFRNDYDAEGKLSARNFAMNLYCNTKTGKANNVQADSKDNYLGFFRFTGTSKANYAYLKYTTDELNGDAQLLHKFLETEDNTTNSTPLSSKMAIIFEGISDDDLGSVTGIKDLEKEKKSGDGYFYNLHGIRVSVPAKGNIYIHNGKKIIVK